MDASKTSPEPEHIPPPAPPTPQPKPDETPQGWQPPEPDPAPIGIIDKGYEKPDREWLIEADKAEKKRSA